MDYRNPVQMPDGRINCEINHPDYGWIPFTADPADTGAQFDVAALHAAMAVDPAKVAYVEQPAPVVVPDIVAKLALVRAMREVGLDGQPVTTGSIWDAVKAAIAQAGGAVEEDWQLANHIPRADPTINALAAQLVPTDPPRQQLLDGLFLRAAELE